MWMHLAFLVAGAALGGMAGILHNAYDDWQFRRRMERIGSQRTRERLNAITKQRD